MFAQRLIESFKKDKRVKDRRVDVITEQVKEMLKKTDQKLILMVRG